MADESVGKGCVSVSAHYVDKDGLKVGCRAMNMTQHGLDGKAMSSCTSAFPMSGLQGSVDL